LNRLRKHREVVIKLTALQNALHSIRVKKNRQALLNFFNKNNKNKLSILNNAGATLSHINVLNVSKGKKKIPVYTPNGNGNVFLLNANSLRNTGYNHSPNAKNKGPYSYGNGYIFVNPLKVGSKPKKQGTLKTKGAPTAFGGCVKQTTKKYTSRKSPPYPANECCGKELMGSNGLIYISKATKSGSCRWVKKVK
jgi:hypothetical protein